MPARRPAPAAAPTPSRSRPPQSRSLRPVPARGLAAAFLVALFAALWGCAGGSTAAAADAVAAGPPQDTAASEVFAFHAPQRVSVDGADGPRSWERRTTFRHVQPSLGYTLRFHEEDGQTAEIHVYPATPDGEALDEAGLGEAIQREFEQGLRDIHALAPQQGMEVEEPEEAWEEAMAVGDARVELRGQTVRFVREGQPDLASHLLVAGKDRAILKVRSSHPEADEEGRGRVMGLLAAVLEELAPAPEAGGAGAAVAGMVNYPTLDERAVPLPDDLPDRFGVRFPEQLHGEFRLMGSGGDMEEADGATALYLYGPANVRFQVLVWPRANEAGTTGAVDEARWEEQLEDWEAQVGGNLLEQGFRVVRPLAEEEPVELATWYGSAQGRWASMLHEGQQGQLVEGHLLGMAIEGRLVLVSLSSLAQAEGSVLDRLFLGFSEELARNLLVGGPPPEGGAGG